MLKAIFIILIISLFCTGCFVEGQYWTYEWDYPNAEEIETIWDAWIHAFTIGYEQNDTTGDWKLPHETYADGNGDCEDFSLVFAYFVFAYVEKTPTLLRVKIDATTFHIITVVDNVTYDIKNQYTGYTINTLPLHIMDSWTYGEAMYLATVR